MEVSRNQQPMEGSRGRYQPPERSVEIRPDTDLGLAPQDLLKAPGVLYAAGDVSLLRDTMRVAIIGARDSSEAGIRRAQKLASLLAREGVVVVSGLAKGVDQAAHRGSLAVDGGRTIAVIGTPLDVAYPAEHAALQEEVYRRHLLVSQFAAGSRVYPSNFVKRNRTMALLSHATVIVEAGDGSGTLSQAAETVRLQRPLFIMQSVLANPDLAWPARFIGKGARVLERAEQILDAVRPT